MDERGANHIEEKRGDLGDPLRRSDRAVQIDGSVARWWTFAGGRVNHTLKYGLEAIEGWKVVADNPQLRIEGDGIGHETVRKAIERMASGDFWGSPEVRRAVLARLPGYRLSKFQDCLPEKHAPEVIENYLLDVAGTVTWLGGSPRAKRPVVELKANEDVPPRVAPGLHPRSSSPPRSK